MNITKSVSKTKQNKKPTHPPEKKKNYKKKKPKRNENQPFCRRVL